MKDRRVPTDEPLAVYLIVLFLSLSEHLNYQTVPKYMAYYLTVAIYTAHSQAVTTNIAHYQILNVYIYIYI